MHSLEDILGKYQNSPGIEELYKHLQDERPARIIIEGTAGAQDSFVLSALREKGVRYLLLIANDKEEAAYYYDDLKNLSGGKQVFFLPDSFKRPLNFERLDGSNALRRTEIVNKVSAEPLPFILITYPEALFEQVVDPQVLADQRIKIEKGEEIDLDFLIEILVKYGFERTDFVYEPGQFSIRGGIIDIFSYGNDWPYRVELFDEDVESIRLFDPMNQLSIREISTIRIVPDVNKNFEQSQKVNLLKVMPDDSVVCVQDITFLLDQLQRSLDAFNEFSKSKLDWEDEGLRTFIEERAVVTTARVMELLDERPLIFFKDPKLGGFKPASVRFESSPQPEFNKQFTLLIENLKENEKEGYTNIIFTDNPKQIERFYAIFKDLQADVSFVPVYKAIRAGFLDHSLKLACYTDHQIFQRFHRYKLKRGFSKSQALNLRMLRELKPGDFVTHIDHGVGKYSGLEKIDINGHKQESVRLLYRNNDILYVSINSLHKISRYVGKEGTAPKLDKLGSDAWAKLKGKTKRKVKDIAQELIRLYAKRKASRGYAFPPDGYLQNELEASFMYEDTPDQLTATQDVKEDMVSEQPMDRLICGDVGFGKTEVAIRAAFKSVVGGKQVAVLVPTTILALQHFRTFKERLDEFGVKVDYLNRFRSQRERTAIFKKMESGEIDIIIGTHSLLNKKVAFKDLGLLIIDEEQKFGVAAKEKLRNLKVNVDTLTLTATPIPRTMQFSLMAARDMSILRTAPPNRQPIHTEVRAFNEEVVREAIYYEVTRGGQVYFVHNRVKSLPQIYGLLTRLCPDIDIVMAHGQMDPKKLEQTLVEFIDQKHDLLLCTNIIETGLDIPNVNTIIVNDAHQFGMSDLHQLRGRVGRSNRKAYCYLFSPPMSVLTRDARKRLQTLEEFSDLGSGFNIAMRDLDIRGAGNLLGAEQSGFIADIGYETYQKILDEAIQELKENEFKDVFRKELEAKAEYVREVTIDTDVEMLIPDAYVSNIQERLNLYTELDTIEDEEGVKKFKSALADRFGEVPESVHALFDALRLRWLCRKLGFEQLVYKNNKLRCYFIRNERSHYYESRMFKKLLAWIAGQESEGLSLKQSRKSLLLVKDDIRSIKQVRSLLEKMIDELRTETVPA